MPIGSASWTVRVLASISEIDASEWDSLNPADAPPVLRWSWLDAMESSGSATARTGWEPAHLTLWEGARLVAAAPAYLKHHSMGEYIYDFGWAQAAQSMGIRYYPKLVIGAPLSPLTAPKLKVRAGVDRPAAQRELVRAALELARDRGCSSIHILFPPEEEAAAIVAGHDEFFRRSAMQYHWHNAGYEAYADFLARFDSKRRNQLKRERAAAEAQGIRIRTIRGPELAAEHARLAFAFYETTCEKNPWGHLQLTPKFFERVFAQLSDAAELVVAERNGRPVAGAFNPATEQRLYGRYWGCFEEHAFLHFNVCLYHSIEDCIQRRIRVFEPGAGGEHKIARGFQPTEVHGVHCVFDERLANAAKAFCVREKKAFEPIFESAEQVSGFRPR